MPDKPERETDSLEQLVLSNVYQQEALINVLERKGILTRKEVLDELEVLVEAKGRKGIN